MAGGAALAIAASLGLFTLGRTSAEPIAPAVQPQLGNVVVSESDDTPTINETINDGGASEGTVKRPAYLIIQDEIDAAVAERKAAAACRSKG